MSFIKYFNRNNQTICYVSAYIQIKQGILRMSYQSVTEEIQSYWICSVLAGQHP